MKCPYCGNPDTRVIDSRPAEDNSSIRRRRSCDECGKRFTTYEKVETIPLIVIKKDNNREQYERAKIENGVLNAHDALPILHATSVRFRLKRFKRQLMRLNCQFLIVKRKKSQAVRLVKLLWRI